MPRLFLKYSLFSKVGVVHFHDFSLLFNFGISKQIWIQNVIPNMILSWNRCSELYLYQIEACKTSTLKKKKMPQNSTLKRLFWKKIGRKTPVKIVSKFRFFLKLAYSLAIHSLILCKSMKVWCRAIFFVRMQKLTLPPKKRFSLKINKKGPFYAYF